MPALSLVQEPMSALALQPAPAPAAAAEPTRTPERIIGEVEQFLQEAIAHLEPDMAERQRGGPGRPRVLPALALWSGLLVCLLRGFTHQRDLWRLLADKGLWSYPRFALSDQAIDTRLDTGTPLDRGWHSPVQHLFEQITALLAVRLTPWQQHTLAPFATEVLALDDTTLDGVARTLPALRQVPSGDARLLPGKLTGLFDVRRQQWHRVEYQANPAQNEKVGAKAIFASLPQGCLLLADLGYFAFPWFDALTAAGHFWISRLRQKTSFTVLHAYFDDGRTFDGLVWLGAHRADKAAHAVRLVRFHVGPTTFSYLTNVLDPKVLPLAEIARLYARRWDIELAFKTVKRELLLYLLWSAKDGVILHQVWAVLILSQILCALRLEIAGRAGVDPFEVSLPLLVRYLPQYAQRGEDPIVGFLAHARHLGFIRPSTRTHVVAPAIPRAALVPRPPNLALTRPPRYAHRRALPRATVNAFD